MDTVKGKRDTKETILVLTERKTRYELNIPMPSNKTENVVTALDRLEVKYGALFPVIFHSITVDNKKPREKRRRLRRFCRAFCGKNFEVLNLPIARELKNLA